MWWAWPWEGKSASVADHRAVSPALNVSTFFNSCFQCASSEIPYISDSADNSFQGSSATAWKSWALPLPVWWLLFFYVPSARSHATVLILLFLLSWVGYFHSSSAFCGQRKDSQPLQEPCPALMGREGNPNILLPYGFGWFVALIISFWQRTIQLCALY